MATKIALILSFLLIPLLFGYGFYLVWKMFCNVRKGRYRIWALLPYALFDSTLFTEQGELYRRKLIYVQLVLLVVCGGLVVYARS